MGHVVAQSGPLIGPNAFSSVAATREWLATDTAKAFTRAYKKARVYVNDASAAEIAANQNPLFPAIDEAALANCIATYQKLGCWTPHIEITPQAIDIVQDVFEHFGTLKQRYAYDQIVVQPPAV